MSWIIFCSKGPLQFILDSLFIYYFYNILYLVLFYGSIFDLNGEGNFPVLSRMKRTPEFNGPLCILPMQGASGL